MSRQAKILDGVKQKSQTTLHNLKKKLQNLEDLVSSNSRSRNELEEELNVNHVFQSTRVSSDIQGDDSYPPTNHRTEMPEHDTYSSRHGQSEKWTSDTVQHKLKTDQSEEDYAKGDAYSYERNQSNHSKPLRGILKRSHSTTDDQPAIYRPRRIVGSASDDIIVSHRPRDKSPPEMLSKQKVVSILAHIDRII